MPPQPKAPFTVGTPSFDPDKFFEAWDSAKSIPVDKDLRGAIIRAFKLKDNDDYVYHAIASVTLSQVQNALNAGRKGRLCAWYRDEQGEEIDPPPVADITAYTSIFAATTITSRALTGFASNAKKGSLRAAIATHLQEQSQPPVPESNLTLPNKQKSSPTNPYLDLWAWSCQALFWAGPTADTVRVRQSHHLLPIFYHHFGCVVPTQDAVHILGQLTKPAGSKNPPREIIEIGSGNGYWTYLLRRHGLTVTAVDNGLSAWRTLWISDTVAADGATYLRKRQGATEVAVLLLVYPQVSNEFTSNVIRAFQGDAMVVAGTQNANGYTGFADERVDTWVERERPEYEKVLQIPLPSFAAKDEALFVFRKRKESLGASKS